MIIIFNLAIFLLIIFLIGNYYGKILSK